MDRRAGLVWLQGVFLSSLRLFPQNILILTANIFQVKLFSSGWFLTTTRFKFVPLKQADSYGLQVPLKTNELYRVAGMPGIPILNLSRKQGIWARGQISTSTGIQESLVCFQIIKTCSFFQTARVSCILQSSQAHQLGHWDTIFCFYATHMVLNQWNWWLFQFQCSQ